MLNTSKSNKNSNQKKNHKKDNRVRLEDVYRQYISPMPVETWSKISDLSQPSILKRVNSRTIYSSVE
jgi:hypothetical protein